MATDIFARGTAMSAIRVAPTHIFKSDTERDTYFTVNPTELKDDLYCFNNEKLQKYVNKKWMDSTPMMKGEKGDKGQDGAKGDKGDKGDNVTDAITAEKLKTPRKINGVEFDGTKDISIGEGGTYDYIQLTNKPQINSIELSGNKSLVDLGIQPSGNYLTSIPAEYITETELTAKDYATKSELPTKTTLGLSNIDNTPDKDKKVASAQKLETPRKINGVEFDGSKDIEIPAGDVTKAYVDTEVAKKIDKTDIGNLADYEEDGSEEKVANIKQTGKSIADIKTDLDINPKEIINLYIKIAKGSKVKESQNYIEIIKSKFTETESNVKIPFSSFTFVNSIDNYDLWKYEVAVKNDLILLATYFDATQNKIRSWSDEFVSHNGRNDRVIILNIIDAVYFGFEPMTNNGEGAIERAKSIAYETVNIEVTMPKGYNYSDIVIMCEDNDYGFTIGKAELKNFRKTNDTSLSGTISLEPNYNAIMYCVLPEGNVYSKRFLTEASRSARQCTFDIGAKIIDVGYDNIMNGTEINCAKAIKTATSMVIDTTITLPSKKFDTSKDVIRFIAESGVTYYSTPVDSIRTPDTDQFNFLAELTSDLYGHMELVRNNVVLCKTPSFITQAGRNDYALYCNYNDNTFIFDGSPEQGTMNAIKAQGGSGGETIHNKLKELQGGNPDGNGQFFHMDYKAYDTVSKIVTDKAIELKRAYTLDASDNIANLVSTSDFSTLYGNRLVGNTQFSNFRKDFTHVYNNGNVNLYQPILPYVVMPKEKYQQVIELGKTGEIEGLKITKIRIQVESTITSVPQVGRIELVNQSDSVIWESCPSGQTQQFIDNFGNYKGVLTFDIVKPIPVVSGDKIVCNFDVASDGILGDKDKKQPSIGITVETLEQASIADVNHFYELIDIAYEQDKGIVVIAQSETGNYSIREINLANGMSNKNGILNIQQTINGKPVFELLNYVNDPRMVLKVFNAKGIEHIKPNEPSRGIFRCENLEEIHLENLISSSVIIAEGCPKLKKVYMDKFEPQESIPIFVDCPDAVIYLSYDSYSLQSYCIAQGLKYVVTNIPTTSEDLNGTFLGCNKSRPMWLNVKSQNIKTDNDMRFVSQDEVDSWTAGKTKLDGIEEHANNYTHPTTHSPSIIAQDADNRFVSDIEKAKWNGMLPIRKTVVVDIDSRPMDAGYYPQCEGSIGGGFPLNTKFSLWNGDYDQTVIAQDTGIVYTRSWDGTNWTSWKSMPVINDTTASATSIYSSNKVNNLISGAMPALTFIDGDKTTINFRTAFNRAGMFRVFNATSNMPPSYPVKDSDFYCSVYYTDSKFQKILASDVRTSRLFVMSQVNGMWYDWLEIGIIEDSGTLVTKTWSAKKISDELAKKENSTVETGLSTTNLDVYYAMKSDYKVYFKNSTSTNLPTGITSGSNSFYLQGLVVGAGIQSRQVLYDLTSVKVWTRYQMAGGTWSAWAVMVS